MITAEQVREAMIEQEISQRQLSFKSNVSASVISSWLSGRAEPSDISKARIALALGLPADAEPEAISRAEEDIAAEKILDILQPEPEPAPESEPTPESEPEPEPAPELEPAPEPEAGTPGPLADSAADLLYRLTRVSGLHIFEDHDHALNVAIPRGSDLERFACNLDTLDTMLQMDDISAEAHGVAVVSLLETYRRKEAKTP